MMGANVPICRANAVCQMVSLPIFIMVMVTEESDGCALVRARAYALILTELGRRMVEPLGSLQAFQFVESYPLHDGSIRSTDVPLAFIHLPLYQALSMRFPNISRIASVEPLLLRLGTLHRRIR